MSAAAPPSKRGPSLASSRRVGRAIAGGFVAALVGGVVGILWWWSRTRTRPPGQRLPGRPGRPVRRITVAALAVMVAAIAMGTVWRSKVQLARVPACQLASAAQPASSEGRSTPGLVAADVLTWPETGLGLLYGDVDGGPQCVYQPLSYYVGFHSHQLMGRRVVNIGDVTLLPTPFDTRSARLRAVAKHEAVHRTQWAVLTALAGPFALPVLYTIDNFFFPGSRNHFERQAGLRDGGYKHRDTGPLLRWPQVLVLAAAAGWGLAILWRRLRRRRRPCAARW